MKVKVNRQLSGGRYHISFEVSDFTADELAKMESFGVPTVRLQWLAQNSHYAANVAINQISKKYVAVFGAEPEAKEYEEHVLNELRTEIQRLRESQDKFSSSEEVPI